MVRLDAGSGLTMLNRATTGSRRDRRHPRLSPPPRAAAARSHGLGSRGRQRRRARRGRRQPDAVLRAVAEGCPGRRAASACRGPAVDFDDVAAEVARADGAGSAAVIATTTSPPLREIATVLMKVSQNLYAETLLKTVGAARGGLGTVAAGQNVVTHVLTSWGVPADAYVAVDGSGLSRYNYVTADTMTAVLEHMYRDPRHRDALPRDAADRRQGRDDRRRGCSARGRRGTRSRRPGRSQRARTLGLRENPRRRDAGVLDPGQRLRDPVGDDQLDRGSGGRDLSEFHPQGLSGTLAGLTRRTIRQWTKFIAFLGCFWRSLAGAVVVSLRRAVAAAPASAASPTAAAMLVALGPLQPESARHRERDGEGRRARREGAAADSGHAAGSGRRAQSPPGGAARLRASSGRSPNRRCPRSPRRCRSPT